MKKKLPISDFDITAVIARLRQENQMDGAHPEMVDAEVYRPFFEAIFGEEALGTQCDDNKRGQGFG